MDDKWVTTLATSGCSPIPKPKNKNKNAVHTRGGESSFAIGLNRDNTVALLWLATPAVSVACINWGKSKNWQNESPHSQNNATSHPNRSPMVYTHKIWKPPFTTYHSQNSNVLLCAGYSDNYCYFLHFYLQKTNN